MTTWKRLTDTDNRMVDVNLDNVTHIVRDFESPVTTLYFVGGSDPRAINVKETVDEIQMKPTVRTFGNG